MRSSNEQVREKVESALTALELPAPAVKKAQTLLKKGEKLIDIHQKNIKIADRSEHGCLPVLLAFYHNGKYQRMLLRVPAVQAHPSCWN